MDELNAMMDAKPLPGFWVSVAPIIIPIVLILLKTVLDFVGVGNAFIDFFWFTDCCSWNWYSSCYLRSRKKEDNKKVLGMMDEAIKDTGIIMLITGAGGSLGNVVKVSGIGTALGEMVTSWPIPAVLIPFIIAALMRIALGSATVAITTAASLTAPLMSVLSISPLLMALSCCVGAISFSYFERQRFLGIQWYVWPYRAERSGKM